MSNSGFTFRRVREEMIENLLEMGIKDFRVLDAMAQIPRHIFIDEALRSRAYENRSITIGYQQTISQPYTVALQTELLKIIDTVISQESQAVEQAKSNPQTINFLVGKVMQATKGKADPTLTLNLLKKQIGI